jgi:quinol monooxygenase YgiN
MPPRPDRYRGPGPGAPGADEPLPGPQASTGGSPAATPARPPYGRILIFTLLDDRVADFDRLAEQTAEEIRTGEPDTLVYVIHLVPNAPMQRIFYEIYRDRAAFDRHESQPYMQRFVAERRSCVLATNVIELRLKYAKVAPLPNPQARAPVPLRVPAPLPPLPSGPPAGARGPVGTPGPQRLQPLPVPQRPDQQRRDQQRRDQQRRDQQRPDQPRSDRWWPDQHRLPSAGGRYGGS